MKPEGGGEKSARVQAATAHGRSRENAQGFAADQLCCVAYLRRLLIFVDESVPIPDPILGNKHERGRG